jgi:butyrate kinase
VIGLIAQLGTKKINSAKAWTSDEDERLRKLIISNAPAFDIAEELGRTVSAVRTRAQALRISLSSSRFRVKAKGK